MSNLRTTTNLVHDVTLQLPRNQLRQNFLYVYNRGFKEKPIPFMFRLWIGLLYPEVTKASVYGKDGRRVRKAVEGLHKYMPAGLTTLKKINNPNDPHFEVTVPLVSTPTDVFGQRMKTFASMVGNVAIEEDNEHQSSVDNMHSAINEYRDNGGDIPAKIYPAAQVIQASGITHPAGLDALRKSLINVSLRHNANRSVFFATFKLSMAEAQQLTNTQWQEIRNVDIYPLMLQWTTNLFGQTGGKAPLASFPISRIAKTLPPVHEDDIRIDEYGISIDPNGSPIYLPRQLDDTKRYEDMFSKAGYNQDDDSFSLNNLSSTVQGVDSKALSLPKNIQVLIDWVNNKYAYTQTTGMLKVIDLTRYRRPDAAHIMSIMRKTKFGPGTISVLVPIAQYAGVSADVHPTEEELDEIKNFDEVAYEQLKKDSHSAGAYCATLVKVYNRLHEDPIFYMTDVTPHSEYTGFQCLYRWMVNAHAAILNNLLSVYANYSVAHVSDELATLTMMVKYGANIEETSAKDLQIRKAALNQSFDPEWELPSIPLLRDKNMVLPHQKKVLCLMKDSPDFAILPVQAGGGKTPIAIMDILYEIKANRSQPYLVLCPPSLVAQYVKEIVYFTDGKMNAIPINTYTIRKHGLERLSAMLASAPRNTLVVCDYDVLRYKQQRVCYGTTNVEIFPIIEFLRQFRFGYMLADESQNVKNASSRTKAYQALVTDIPKKRLASGTMVHDSSSDLALQIASLDPTLFGSRDQFNQRFGEKVSGDRVIQWKPGAQQEISAVIKSRIVVAGAMRKEWAAILPQAKEMFHRVTLTEGQREVYKVLFGVTIDAIKEAARTSRRLAEFVTGKKIKEGDEDGEGTPEEGNDDESAQDEFEDEDLAALLQPYLARLEQFVTSPTSDELGDRLLQGEDRISPKITKIHEIMRKHMEDGIPGKVLVFTTYIANAEDIFNTLPPDMKAKAILYVASEKVEAGAAFEHDDSKLFMIGVEQSMNTGLNLQHASRLIRANTVWNPGTFEQGNARVNRPELKSESRRKEIYFDIVIADRSIDITKISRLISKIVANAKFENADNPTYESIPDVPIMKMTLDTVEEHNDWGDPSDPNSESTLAVYGNAYAEYRQCLYDDYKEYREKNGNLKIERVAIAPTPKDARLMHSVPYTPGLEIYGADQLGLLRIDDYLRLDAMDDSDEGDNGDEDSEEVKDAKADANKKRLVNELIGQPVHTDQGDGTIRSVSFAGRFVTVDLPTGSILLKFSLTFLITRANTSTKDIRTQLLKEVGDMPIDAPLTHVAPAIRQDAKSIRRIQNVQKEKIEKEKIIKQKEMQKQMAIELHLSVANGFLCLSYFPEESTAAATNILQSLGFNAAQQFYAAPVTNAARLEKQLALWNEKGLLPDPKIKELKEAFGALHGLLTKGKATPLLTYKFASQGQLRNFYKLEQKPNANPSIIKPYPLIEDGHAFIVLPIHGQAGTPKAIRIKAPGIKWTLSDPTLMYFGLTLAKLVTIAKKISEAGIQVTNMKDVNKAFRTLKKMKLRNVEEE